MFLLLLVHLASRICGFTVFINFGKLSATISLNISQFHPSLLGFQLRIHACMLSHFSHIWFFATPRTVACHAPLSMWFSRQEYWSGLPSPPPRDVPKSGIKPAPLVSPALTSRFLTSWAIREAHGPLEIVPQPSDVLFIYLSLFSHVSFWVVYYCIFKFVTHLFCRV